MCVLVMMYVCWQIVMPPPPPPALSAPPAAGYLSECVTSAGRQAGLRGRRRPCHRHRCCCIAGVCSCESVCACVSR